MSRRNLLTESVLVTFTLLVLLLLFQAHPVSPRVGLAGEIVIPLFCLLVPWSILTIRRESFAEFGLHLEGFSRSLGTGLLFSLFLLTPYFVAFYIWSGRPEVHFPGWHGSIRWLKLCLFQVFYIALPEEIFFRGYLQTRLNQVLGRPYAVLGARIGGGLLGAAAVFMLLHLVYAVNLWTLGILVPALIFGWLREKTGSITASTVFHALSNILLFTFQGKF